jgi:hypothetical protein
MSPTATIATVIVALVFFAWLFQSETRDPGYEAWRKRQMEEKKEEENRREVAGATVTDPKGIADPRSLEEIRRDRQRSGLPDNVAAPVAIDITESEGDPFRGVPAGQPGDATAVNQSDVPDPLQVQGKRASDKGFGKNQLLSGTYVGVAYVGDTPKRSAKGDEPAITFRRDGTFTTQNMASAEVDMESGTALGAQLDRGSGRYSISGTDLLLTYNDGLNRKKGNKRSYVITPLAGPDEAPTAITIQGKLFKLDSQN